MGFEIPYKKIVNTATTNKASRLINGKTIHSILMIKPQKDTSTGKDVLRRQGIPNISGNIFFIDECSMLDTAKLDMILQIKKQLPDLKIVMIGDRGQIHSIEDKDSDNTLVSDEDKEGFAPSVVFTYKNKKEAALLTRVR